MPAQHLQPDQPMTFQKQKHTACCQNVVLTNEQFAEASNSNQPLHLNEQQIEMRKNMKSVFWNPNIEDLADFFPYTDNAHAELSVALRKIHITLVSETRAQEKALRTSHHKGHADTNALNELWKDCAFALAYLRAVNSENEAVYIVAQLLETVLISNQTTPEALMRCSEKLSDLSVHLRKQSELSQLIETIAQSIMFHAHRVARFDLPYAA